MAFPTAVGSMTYTAHSAESLSVVRIGMNGAGAHFGTGRYRLGMAAETANQRQWRVDAELLASIRAHLIAAGVAKVEVRLPAKLGRQTIKAWDRDDEQDGKVDTETREQPAVRRKAATLALIGLSISESGRFEGEDVVVTLSADLVGNAVAVSDDD